MCARGGYDTVKQNYCEEVDHGAVTGTWAHNQIASKCDTCSVWVDLFWSLVDYDVSVRDNFPSLGRHIPPVNEEEVVNSLDSVRDSLGEASKFFAV